MQRNAQVRQALGKGPFTPGGAKSTANMLGHLLPPCRTGRRSPAQRSAAQHSTAQHPPAGTAGPEPALAGSSWLLWLPGCTPHTGPSGTATQALGWWCQLRAGKQGQNTCSPSTGGLWQKAAPPAAGCRASQCARPPPPLPTESTHLPNCKAPTMWQRHTFAARLTVVVLKRAPHVL